MEPLLPKTTGRLLPVAAKRATTPGRRLLASPLRKGSGAAAVEPNALSPELPPARTPLRQPLKTGSGKSATRPQGG